MQANSSTDQSPIAPAIAIAKNTTAYAFSAGSSIYEGYVDGPTPKKVITIGDNLGGKTVTGLQLAEKNFVSDQGDVAFRAGFSDGTSAIFEASPTLGTLPFSALKSNANCLSCVFTAPANDEDGFGTDIAKPLYISINPHGPVVVTVPDGELFTSLQLAEFTTDDHGQTQKSFMLHLGAFSTKIVANEPVLFKPFELGGNFDPFLLFNGLGTQSFVLDHFVGFPDAHRDRWPDLLHTTARTGHSGAERARADELAVGKYRVAWCVPLATPDFIVRPSNSSKRGTVNNPPVLALFGWAFQNLRADEFLICVENPTISRMTWKAMLPAKKPAKYKPPVSIPLTFDDAVTGLLGVKPKPTKKSAAKKSARLEKPLNRQRHYWLLRSRRSHLAGFLAPARPLEPKE